MFITTQTCHARHPRSVFWETFTGKKNIGDKEEIYVDALFISATFRLHNWGRINSKEMHLTLTQRKVLTTMHPSLRKL